MTTMNAARLLIAFSDDVAGEPRAPIDVIFPVLHGPFGEDGSVQGLAHWSMCPRPSPQDRRAGPATKAADTWICRLLGVRPGNYLPFRSINGARALLCRSARREYLSALQPR